MVPSHVSTETSSKPRSSLGRLNYSTLEVSLRLCLQKKRHFLHINTSITWPNDDKDRESFLRVRNDIHTRELLSRAMTIRVNHLMLTWTYASRVETSLRACVYIRAA